VKPADISVHLRRIKTNRFIAKDVNHSELRAYYDGLDLDNKKINMLTLLFLLSSSGMFSIEESLEYVSNINNGIMPDTNTFLEFADLSYELLEEHLFDSEKKHASVVH
jgi:hypothetical protein